MLKGQQQLTGKVVRQIFGKGSKSEHNAVMLQAGDEQWVLRRQGGNAFRDPELEALVGKTIRCTGRLAGHTFLMSDWSETDAPSGR
jgi:hypothetical protein